MRLTNEDRSWLRDEFRQSRAITETPLMEVGEMARCSGISSVSDDLLGRAIVHVAERIRRCLAPPGTMSARRRATARWLHGWLSVIAGEILRRSWNRPTRPQAIGPIEGDGREAVA